MILYNFVQKLLSVPQIISILSIPTSYQKLNFLLAMEERARQREERKALLEEKRKQQDEAKLVRVIQYK